MASSDELCFMPATRLTGAIQRREISPVEVTNAVLGRIEKVNPKLNAFTVVLAEQALAAAKKAEAAAARGDKLGILHGVPFTIKDLTPTKGVKTMSGSKAFANNVPEENGVPVDRMLAAGGIFVGKTTTPELGNKGITESPLTGTTCNPWKTTHITGGSSGGAAAAVASGLGQLAEGSDGGGSIRIPASCCGVVGLKPSFGRVPFYPMFPVFESLVHQGPITRTVADAALMLTALAGPDDRDPYSISETGVDYLKAIQGASVRGMKIAYSHNLGLGPVDPEVEEKVGAAAKVFAGQLGASVEEATPDVPNPEAAMMTYWAAVEGTMGTDLVLPAVGRGEVDPALLALVDAGAKLSAFDFYRASQLFRADYYNKMIGFFQKYELLLTPTIALPPFPHPGWAGGPEAIAGKKLENRVLGWLLTYPFNLTGQPAITVPCGFSREGLPIGLQIVGRRHADATVLRAAAAYEQAAPWADRRPPVD